MPNAVLAPRREVLRTAMMDGVSAALFTHHFIALALSWKSL